MNAREIAVALGDARREGHDWRAKCPVHGGHGLTLCDGRGGKLLVKCWGGCQWREILDELRSRGLIEGNSPAPNPERDEEHRRRKESETKAEIERLRRRICGARDVYRRAQQADNTPVEVYLRSRGIRGPISSALRWLRVCPHRNGGHYPAMLAPVVGVAGEQIGVHKSFLCPDGSGQADLPKAEQRETCGPFRGGAIRLAPHRAGVELLVGEGIESTLSAMQMFGLPGWAAISAGGVEALELPPEIRSIAIAADNDESLTGQRAALSAQARWSGEGHAVRILLPPNIGEDFNDVLLSG